MSDKTNETKTTAAAPQPSKNVDAVSAKQFVTTSTAPSVKPDAATQKKVEAERLAKNKKPDLKVAPAAAPSSKSKEPDFRSLKTVEELLDTYNDMVPTAIDFKIPKVGTVKSFVDVKTGVLACERLHALILKARKPKAEEVEKTETAADTTKSKPESKKMATKSKKSKSNARKAVKGKTTAKRPRASFDDKAKIVKLKDNPYREGTGRYKRVQTLLACKTVGAFHAKRGKDATITKCVADKVVKLA